MLFCYETSKEIENDRAQIQLANSIMLRISLFGLEAMDRTWWTGNGTPVSLPLHVQQVIGVVSSTRFSLATNNGRERLRFAFSKRVNASSLSFLPFILHPVSKITNTFDETLRYNQNKSIDTKATRRKLAVPTKGKDSPLTTLKHFHDVDRCERFAGIEFCKRAEYSSKKRKHFWMPWGKKLN